MARTARHKVLEFIDEARLVELTRALVRIPSPTGQEGPAARFLIDHLRALGLETEGYEGSPGRPNVVARLRGTKGTPTVMLSTHLDTMPAGDLSEWVTDPFGAEVVDGRICGRGAMDSKGGIAAAVVAVDAVRRARTALRGDVLVAATVDEETAGPAGLGFLVEQGIVDPDHSIYIAHSDLNIKACFKGFLWTNVSFRGQAAHGSMPASGVNAIVHAGRFVQDLPGHHFRYARHPILGDFTVNVGWIRSGGEQKYNLVADHCDFGLDMRLVPGQTPEEVLKEMSVRLDEFCRSTHGLSASVEAIVAQRPMEIDEGDPTIRAIQHAAQDVLGRTMPFAGSISTGTFGPLFARGKTGVAFGPGELDRCNGHRANEFLEIDQLAAASKIYALALLDLAG